MLRFPLIVGVVFIHAYGFKARFAGGEPGPYQVADAATLVEYYLSHVVAPISVPLFYFMSGFLFFAHFDGTAQAYGSKLKSRVRTLLVPYLFWNILTIGLLALAQANTHTAHYFSGAYAPISSFGPFDYLNALAGFTRAPVAYQFWFIRDLMILVLLSPLLYLLTRYLFWPTMLFLVCAWMSNWFHLNFGLWRMLSSEAVLFFFLGEAAVYSGWSAWSLEPGSRLGKWIFLSYLIISVIDLISRQAVFNRYIHNIGMLLGIVSVIWLAGFLGRMVPVDGLTHGNPPVRVAKIFVWLLEALSPAAFFVFAAHDPLLTFIEKIFYSFCAPSDAFVALMIYLMAPFLAILICISLYLGIRKTAPSVARTICGGR
jgi:surface polysaccharide O-acyltransferase-like enzyme